MSKNETQRLESDGSEPTCDRCGNESKRFTPVHETPWHSEYNRVCGPCLLTDDVDPFADDEHDNHPDEQRVSMARCENCGRKFDENAVGRKCPGCGGNSRPTRSEPADFGGGESTGVQEL